MTGGTGGDTGHVVLLVDGGGGLARNLAGVAGQDGVNEGLGQLTATVQVEVLVDEGEGCGSTRVGRVHGERGFTQKRPRNPGGVGVRGVGVQGVGVAGVGIGGVAGILPSVVVARVDVPIVGGVGGDSSQNKNLNKSCEQNNYV